MAALLRHAFDIVGVCPVDGCFCEQRFDFEDIVPNEANDALGSARAYTCTSCKGSYHRDWQPLDHLTDDDIGKIIDHRAWAQLRRSTIIGLALPASVSAPGPVSRGVRSDVGFYSLVGDLVF